MHKPSWLRHIFRNRKLKSNELNWWQFILLVVIPLILYATYIVPDAYHVLFARQNTIVTEATISDCKSSGTGKYKSYAVNYTFNYQGKKYPGEMDASAVGPAVWMYCRGNPSINVYFDKTSPEQSKSVYWLSFWGVLGIVFIYAYVKVLIRSLWQRKKKYPTHCC